MKSDLKAKRDSLSRRQTGRRILQKNPDHTTRIVELITERIVSGAYIPGTLLPAEGTLAKSCGVSRTVMREAMRVLRGLGLIEMSQGKRARVNPATLQGSIFSIDLLLRRNHASLLNLIEVRAPLEVAIAGLAAKRASDEHIRQLELTIYQMVSTTDTISRIDADIAFHRILAEATGNPVCVLVLQMFTGFLREAREKTLNYSGVELAVNGHREILTTIKAKDSEGAQSAMSRHMESAQRDLHSVKSATGTKNEP